MNLLKTVFDPKSTSSRLAAQRRRIGRQELYAMLDGIAGMQVTGINGAGKTIFGQNLAKAAIDAETISLHVFDPPGSLVRSCVNDVLSKGTEAIDRTYVIAPGNTQQQVCSINPLHTLRESWMTDYDFESRLECKVGHAAEMTLSLFGDGNFESRPNQFHFTNTILRTLAKLNLTMADYVHFFPESPMHSSFIRCLPDRERCIFERLEQMDEATYERLIGSTKVRFDSIFRAPVLNAVLGVADPNKCLHYPGLIRENAICFYDLATYGAMGNAQRDLLANYYLSELFFSVLNMPSDQWERHLIVAICDEFPVFANATATAALLTQLIPQIRKMNIRLVMMHQGVHPFTDGQDSQLLRTITSNCTNVIFRHKDTVDCKYFGDLVSLPELDPLREKLRETEQEQYVAGERIVTTVNYSVMFSRGSSRTSTEGGAESFDLSHNSQNGTTDGETVGSNQSKTHTEGEGETDGTSSSNTHTSGHGQADHVRDAFGTPTSVTQGRNSSDATQDGSNHASSTNTSDATQAGTSQQHSIQNSNAKTDGFSLSSAFNWTSATAENETLQTGCTYNQTILPVYAWRQVTRFLELMTFDEQRQLRAQDIALLPVGHCIVYLAGQLPFFLQVPLPENPFPYDTDYFREQLSLFEERLELLPCCETGQLLLDERKRITEVAIERLRRLQLKPTQQQRLLNPLDDPDNEV